jgi:hypothetical protein
LHDGAVQRNFSIERTGCSDHTVFAHHRRFHRLAGRQADDKGNDCARRKVYGFDRITSVKQNTLMFELY